MSAAAFSPHDSGFFNLYNMADEEKVHKALATELSQHFTVYNYVVNTGSKDKYQKGAKEIDMILVHESGIHLGVEVKCNEDIYKGKDVADWVRQIATYERKLWFGHRVLIFAYPQISGRIFEEGEIHTNSSHCAYTSGTKSAHHNVSTFLGNFGCGEIVEVKGKMYNDTFQMYTSYRGYQFNHSGYVIWNESQGLNMENWQKVMDIRSNYMPKKINVK
jgi:hypothetical protein